MRALVCLASLLWAVSLGAAVVRVPSQVPTIQGGIDYVGQGDTVLVAPGTYTIDRSLGFNGKGITVRSEAGAEATVIRMRRSGAPLGSIVVFQSGETSSSVLDGFTLEGGNSELHGGGIQCLEGTSPTLRNLIVQLNRTRYGGGMYCKNSSPTMIGCVLARNHVTCGGGIFCDGASPTLIRCRIEGNRGFYAGTVHSKNGSTPHLRDCTIIGNQTYYGGGVDSFQSAPVLVNCEIVGNVASYGGAAYLSGGELTIIHSTIVSNRCTQGPAVSEGVVLQNCLLWDNLNAVSSCAPSCIKDTDPLFLDAGEFAFGRYVAIDITGTVEEMPDFIIRPPDLHLRAGSPAINEAAVLPEAPADLDGNRRPCGALADFGARERCSQAASFLRGDPSADGTRDMSDAVGILTFLFIDATAGLPCEKSADLDDDGEVTLTDAVALLGHLYLGEPPIAEPSDSCGADTTEDMLACDSYPPCS